MWTVQGRGHVSLHCQLVADNRCTTPDLVLFHIPDFMRLASPRNTGTSQYVLRKSPGRKGLWLWPPCPELKSRYQSATTAAKAMVAIFNTGDRARNPGAPFCSLLLGSPCKICLKLATQSPPKAADLVLQSPRNRSTMLHPVMTLFSAVMRLASCLGKV